MTKDFLKQFFFFTKCVISFTMEKCLNKGFHGAKFNSDQFLKIGKACKCYSIQLVKAYLTDITNFLQTMLIAYNLPL